MAKDTEMKNALNATGKDAQYDERAKRLLSNKFILAHILAKTVDEFLGMNPKDIVPHIEGEPFISMIPIDPGLTNTILEKDGERIVGLNTEHAEIHEGMVRFDIIFYVRMKDGLSQVIVNLEAQKDEPTSYHILNRAIFYVSRLVSSQKERDFVGMNYNDIKRVFSIWVCMNMDKNSMTHIHLAKEDLLESYPWKGRLDLLNIVMIGIADTLPGHDAGHELHRLLNTLLSIELSTAEKLEIMETEYSIPVDEEIRKDVSEMCNLSQGIFEKGEARGEAKGEAKGEARGKAIGKAMGEARIILNMHKNGYSIEQIASATDKAIEEVRAIVERKEPLLI